MAACLQPLREMPEKNPLVMVVDDDRDFLQLTQQLLERHGYHVDARTRAPSWSELLRIDPAVILMDVVLDGENGSDVCRAIKSHHGLAMLPIILISGHGEDRLKKEVDRCNANGYLTKPIGKALLLQLAHHFVRQHYRTQGARGAWSTARSSETTGTKAMPPHHDPALPYENENPPAESHPGQHPRAENKEDSKE